MNKFNNKDLRAVFGTVVLNSEDFLPFPKRKESLKHDFPDTNGLDIDLAQPTFAAREFKLKCVLEAVGDNEELAKANFWNLWNGLFTEVSAVGVHELYLGAISRTFYVYYINQQSVSKMSFENGRIVVSFEIVFGETDPYANIQKVYLVDHNDKFLIA